MKSAIDFSHLHAIELRLSNTRMRRDNAKDKDKLFWEHEIRMVEKELAGEYKFLGIEPPDNKPVTDTEIEELLSELGISE